jgi:WS/DGAT/MGAT family acyltransferase
MVDGVSGVDVASVLLDTSSDPFPDTKPDSSRAVRPAPSFVSLLTDAVIDQIRQPLDLVREAAFPRAGGRRALLELAGGLMPLIEIGKLGPAPPSSLNLPVGPERLWEMLSISLADIKRVRTGLGGTVNDVVLAVIAGALRSLLLGRNETVPEELRVLVPVNVRRPDARGTLGNQVAALFCPLPVGEPDAVNRLRQISAVTKGLKESGQAIGAMALTRLGDFAPPALAAMATRLQSVAPWFNIVVTNVPGPQVPLFLMGHRLAACYPAVPLTTYTTVSVALLSYNGMIGIGLLGDADHASDLPRLAQSIPSALVELVRAAGKGPGAPGGDSGAR